MTFDILKILEGKRALRDRLARLPVAEKLAMLDLLRERACTIRAAATRPEATVLRESPPEYRVNPRKA